MYPARELNELGARKASIRARIAEHRGQCAIAAVELSRPLAMVDQAIALWRRVPPVAKAIAVPVLVLLARKLSSRRGVIGSIARMAPTVLNVARTVAARAA